MISSRDGTEKKYRNKAETKERMKTTLHLQKYTACRCRVVFVVTILPNIGTLSLLAVEHSTQPIPQHSAYIYIYYTEQKLLEQDIGQNTCMTFSTYNSSSNPKGSDHVLCIAQITLHVKGSPKSSSHVCALLHLLPRS